MIADILTNTASFSLPALLTVVVAFGFAPGFCMRLIVMMYPHTDPRRHELYAEMKAVPRIERPLWVAEQLETGLFEGLASRRREAKARKYEKILQGPSGTKAKNLIQAGEVVGEVFIFDDQKLAIRRGPDGNWIAGSFRPDVVRRASEVDGAFEEDGIVWLPSRLNEEP